MVAAAGSPAAAGEASSQDAHKDGHPQEAEPPQHASQHGLWQEAWQLGAGRVDLQACARSHEGGPVSRLSGLRAAGPGPGPPSRFSPEVETLAELLGRLT